MQKLKSFTRQRPTGGLLGSELEELARAATKKTLPAPDEELIQQVSHRAWRTTRWSQGGMWQACRQPDLRLLVGVNSCPCHLCHKAVCCRTAIRLQKRLQAHFASVGEL